MNFEVIEIYPYEEQILKKIIEKYEDNKIFYIKDAGTVHIYFKDFELDIKNIEYKVFHQKRKKDFDLIIKINIPYKVYNINNESIRVPNFSWRNLDIWKEVKETIKKEIMEAYK